MPLRADVEFPDNDLARCYRQSIERSKIVLPGESFTVSMKLLSSVVDLEMSQSLGSIIMHFDKEYDEKTWIDDICRLVNGKLKQVYFKQYWNDAEFAKLRNTLEKKPDQAHEEVFMRPDRAGTPPAVARRSEREADRTPAIFRRGRRLLLTGLVYEENRTQILVRHAFTEASMIGIMVWKQGKGVFIGRPQKCPKGGVVVEPRLCTPN